ncbi:hypothetical protein H2516_004603, partial [Salmonella enterica]|nr:hypothetical protein [Salmonella enterica]
KLSLTISFTLGFQETPIFHLVYFPSGLMRDTPLGKKCLVPAGKKATPFPVATKASKVWISFAAEDGLPL